MEKQIKDLIEAYENYIIVLSDEIDDLIGIAYSHGWKSSRYEAGIQCREKIKELKNKLDSQSTNEIGDCDSCEHDGLCYDTILRCKGYKYFPK